MNASAREPQAARAVLMVRPAAFARNPETLASNAFQSRATTRSCVTAAEDVAAAARADFDAVVEALAATGVRAHVVEGRSDGDCADEIFPNNWVSFHADGTAVLYPMLAPSRRRERRPEILEMLERGCGYRITRVIDLSGHEADGRALEGTGSLVLDRERRIAYACRSPRTSTQALDDFAARLRYRPIVFAASDQNGTPVYHTNVVMSLGTRFAVICLEAVTDPGARRMLATTLAASGREVIDISLEQMSCFAANVIELAGRDGPAIALSATARGALDDRQLRRLASRGRLVTAAIPTIEIHGGGSLRCMLAEIFLPR